MPYRALALDFDGTLSPDRQLGADVATAIQQVRAAGCRVLLVTGRILDELRREVPDIDQHFDALVAENGAVLSGPGGLHRLARPVEPELSAALQAAGVPHQRGEVLLACDARDHARVVAEITRLGLDAQVVRNRGALMVLPGGVSKGTGVLHALSHLGISFHSALAIGDAENDLALLASCELGVAVADAVGSLKQHADIVLDQPDGAGVLSFLRGPIVEGVERVHSAHRRIDLGVAPDGSQVAIPASRVSVLVVGGSNRGKSFVAGLLAEQLIEQAYSVLVIDPEGDHIGLGDLPGAVVLGGTRPMLEPAAVMRIVDHRFGSVILDLSQLSHEAAATYAARLAPMIEAHRASNGSPHWVVVDEAQSQVRLGGPWHALLGSAHRGICLVTYQPAGLPPEAVASVDAVVVVGELDAGAGDVLAHVGAEQGIDAPATTPAAAHLRATEALLVYQGTWTVCSLRPRATPHVRHMHKDVHSDLPLEHRFYFDRGWGSPTGMVAANLGAFRQLLTVCDASTLAHHLRGADFSRWVEGVIADAELAAALREVEERGGAPEGISVDEARKAVLAAINSRYPA
jgi:hydroxymethylpyrimidine pyrophosphatase-like HAD family hydrolase